MRSHSMKHLFWVLTVFFSLAAVQTLWAAEVSTVAGIVDEIHYKPNMVVVDGTEVYGVPYNMLEKYNIVLDEGDSVAFEVFEYVCSSGEIRLKAYSITVGDVTVAFREVP